MISFNDNKEATTSYLVHLVDFQDIALDTAPVCILNHLNGITSGEIETLWQVA